MRSAVKVLGILAFLGILIFLALYLFFPETLSFLEKSAFLQKSVRQPANFYGGQAADQAEQADQAETRPLLTVAFAEDASSLEPTSLDPDVRVRTVQIYEPLVEFDTALRIQPALARSFGRINDNEWEFRLRENVKFHHGRYLKSDDVIASFRRASEFSRSELKNFFEGVRMISLDDFRLRVITPKPDPFLLSKLTTLLILPKEYAGQMTFSPTGTGPYRFISLKKNEEMNFKRFDEYWGRKPVYERVTYHIIPDRNKRLKAFTENEVDFLPALSPSQAAELARSNYPVLQFPTLETNFLVFNMNGVFRNPRLRDAVNKALNRSEFVKLVEGYGKSASQFVPGGVFGFDPSIIIPAGSLESARNLVRRVSKLERIPAKIALFKGFENIGQYFKEHLDAANFDVTLAYGDVSEFPELAKLSDLYFFGWKSDFGSSFDFLNRVTRTNGEFNFAAYSNPDLDALIEKASSVFDSAEQLRLLQKAMKMVVEDDPFGIPLLQPLSLSVAAQDVQFNPRIDGQIFLKDIR